MKIHRDLCITQQTAWYMIHQIRQAWNMPKDAAAGTVCKTAVVGMKDRKSNKVEAVEVARTNQNTLQGFMKGWIVPAAKVYTDELGGYAGTYHKMSVNHLAQHVNEFAGRHNVCGLDTIAQMSLLAAGMDCKRFRYQDLI